MLGCQVNHKHKYKSKIKSISYKKVDFTFNIIFIWTHTILHLLVNLIASMLCQYDDLIKNISK